MKKTLLQRIQEAVSSLQTLEDEVRKMKIDGSDEVRPPKGYRLLREDEPMPADGSKAKIFDEPSWVTGCWDASNRKWADTTLRKLGKFRVAVLDDYVGPSTIKKYEPLSLAELRDRALSGKTMYYEFGEGSGYRTGIVCTFHCEKNAQFLLDIRAVFLDGNKAYHEITEVTEPKLCVGGTYLNRRGDVVKIEKRTYEPTYPFEDSFGGKYREDGRWLVNPHEKDLIKEV